MEPTFPILPQISGQTAESSDAPSVSATAPNGKTAQIAKMKLTITDKNIGTVGYGITAELTDEVQAVLIEQGLLRILQGPVASEYEAKAIGLVFPLAVDKDGKHSRKALEAAIERGDYPAFTDEDGKVRKFSRSDLPYSDELAAIWQKCCKGAEIVVSGEGDNAVKADLGIEEVPTAIYEGAKAAEPKFAREKAFVQNYLSANGGKLRDGNARTAESFASTRGLLAPTEPWAEDVAWLATVKTWLTAKLAEEAASE